MRVKSSGLARGLANARPQGSAPSANAPPPGLTWRANAPQLPEGGGGGWAQVELTDSLAFGKPVEEAEENALWLIIITVSHFLCVSVLGC